MLHLGTFACALCMYIRLALKLSAGKIKCIIASDVFWGDARFNMYRNFILEDHIFRIATFQS